MQRSLPALHSNAYRSSAPRYCTVSLRSFGARCLWYTHLFFSLERSAATEGSKLQANGIKDLYPHVLLRAFRAVLMGTKSCTKILNFSTRFSCENLAVEDFVTLLMGKKYCWWGNVMFGHNFGILVMLFYAGEIQNSNELPKAGNGNVFFPNTGWDLQEQTKLYLYSSTTTS